MKAYEILSDPNRWIQRSYAKDKDGKPVAIADEKAFCFCAAGALHRAYPDPDTFFQQGERLNVHLEEIGFHSISQWNDAPDRTHDEVVATLKHLDI